MKKNGDIETKNDRTVNWYSYDLHGNVNWFVQDLSLINDSDVPSELGRFLTEVKYEYDLVSGNVKAVSYNPGWEDSYYQQYFYDEDNRLEKVESCRDHRMWDRDASYSYYMHGPLKRIELGEDSLQGIDYTYTVHGWLKAINSTTMTNIQYADPGNDGRNDPTLVNPHQNYCPDVFGSIYGYYKEDYINLNEGYNFYQPNHNYLQYMDGTPNLYNGNISSWELLQENNLVGGKVFQYDVLNRLTSASYTKHDISPGNNTWRFANNPNQATYSYDANGNIYALNRGTEMLSDWMDELTYDYVTGTNKLDELVESAADNPMIDNDLKLGTYSYGYDKIGNLKTDINNDIQNIDWTPDGKVESVQFTEFHAYDSLNFTYDPAGNRVKKIVVPAAGSNTITYYARGANGKVKAIYEFEYDPDADPIIWNEPESHTFSIIEYGPPSSATMSPTHYIANPSATMWYWEGVGRYVVMDENNAALLMNNMPKVSEWHIYGSESHGRFAIRKPEQPLRYVNLSEENFALENPPYFSYIPRFTRQLLFKQYELKDHLGNVRSVISDLKIPTGLPAPQPEFMAKLLASYDYFPFGMEMPNFGYVAEEYRYGFGGHEKDDEIKGNSNHLSFGNMGYDPRIGRRWNLDPFYKVSESNYATFSNNPVYFVDPDGYDVIPTNDLLANESVSSLLTLASKNSVFRSVLNVFYENQNHVYIHLAQIKSEEGIPTGFTNPAITEPWGSKNNPVGKYGIHRIVLNKDLLSSDKKLNVDNTFVFACILHESIHARMIERYKQDKFNEYPGHKDFLNRGGEFHHNQMGKFNRKELIDGMIEYDNQLRDEGFTIPDYHTDDWYEAMSWYGLRRTQSWKDFKTVNPKLAEKYSNLINEQIDLNKKAIEGEK